VKKNWFPIKFSNQSLARTTKRKGVFAFIVILLVTGIAISRFLISNWACPNRFYLASASLCRPCLHPNCQSCDQHTGLCKVCRPGAFAIQGTCATCKTPANTDSCLSCQGGNQQCLTCTDPFVVPGCTFCEGSHCISCSNGYELDPYDGTCYKCQEEIHGCKSCKSKK
jgi:hypothetical protein